MLTLYGISNCDTVRKARRWLDEHGAEYRFHDFRKDGLSAAIIEQWYRHADESQLLNRRSRTWRELDSSDTKSLDKNKATRLMQNHPTVIRRPLLQSDDTLIIGFDEAAYQRLAG